MAAVGYKRLSGDDRGRKTDGSVGEVGRLRPYARISVKKPPIERTIVRRHPW